MESIQPLVTRITESRNSDNDFGSISLKDTFYPQNSCHDLELISLFSNSVLCYKSNHRPLHLFSLYLTFTANGPLPLI